MSSTGTSHLLGIAKETRRRTLPPPGMPMQDGEPESDKVPDDTIITPGNWGYVILTKDSLTTICNEISVLTKRALNPTGVKSVVNFIQRLPATKFYNLTLEQARVMMAKDYVRRATTEANAQSETGDVGKLAGMEDEGPAAMSEYQKRELMQLSGRENQYKFRAASDRRGNALIDSQRVEGLRSSPDSVAPAASLPYSPNGPPGPISNYSGFNRPNLTGGFTGEGRDGNDTRERIENRTGSSGAGTVDEMLKVLIPTMKAVNQTLDPDSILRLLHRQRDLYNTYDNITMVRQKVQFDSRNSVLNAGLNEIKWYIHTAGQQGQIGAIRMEDTLQHFVAVSLDAFWLPITDLSDDYYETIHMDIKELQHLNIPVTEYLDPGQNQPTTTRYVFELAVKERILNRLYVVPKVRTFLLREPADRLEHLTVEFRTPFELLTLQPDRIYFTMTYGNPTVLVSVQPHNLVTGDRVYIYNSNTGNVTIDNQLTQKTGWYVNRIDDFTINIAYDTSSLVGDQTGILLFLASKRISFQLEFLSLDA